MSTCVIDASVAAKWLLPSAGEPLAEEALELLRDYVEGRLRMIVPDLFWAELGNILWKAVRLRRIPDSTATKALQVMVGRNLPTVSSRVLLDDAFAIARTFDRTLYDALYLALAVQSKCPCITADERLARALAAHLPVKLLGSLEY